MPFPHLVTRGQGTPSASCPSRAPGTGRPGAAPTSGLRRAPRGARALRQGGHPRGPRTAAPGEARARPRGPLRRLRPGRRVPGSALCPRSPPCGPTSPGRSSERRGPATGRWLLGAGPRRSASSLPARGPRGRSGAGRPGRGRARGRGRGEGRGEGSGWCGTLRPAPRRPGLARVAGCSAPGEGGSPSGQNPLFRLSWSLPGAVLSFPDKAHDLGLHCHHVTPPPREKSHSNDDHLPSAPASSLVLRPSGPVPRAFSPLPFRCKAFGASQLLQIPLQLPPRGSL